jgi:hypothetical protein
MDQGLFNSLKEILQPYEPYMTVVQDDEDNYYLDCRKEVRKDMPMFFASIKANKDDITFQLMPVYAYPELLSGVSADLRVRMQGKSRFNFSNYDAAVFEDLKELTRKGFERFREHGYVEE